MERKIMKYLTDWKNSPYRKPLILEGARQTGKTYSILAFGREKYANVAYFNFETNPGLIKTFSESVEPSYLVPLLSRICGQTIIKEKTLVVFDEVQLCERALTAFKYFCELAPEYHVAAAGSMLGVAVNREAYSFPVGKVDIKAMCPMDMEEFLLAFGERQMVGQIRECFENDALMPAALHDLALDYYRRYLVVGGMPECVEKYIATKDHNLLRHTQAMIIESYLRDMSKYNKENEIKKVRLVYNNITVQLSKKNTRFQYKMIKQGARAAEYENAIEWLALSGIASRVHRVGQPTKPLENYRDIDSFKIYASDVGLLCAKNNVAAEDILYQSDDLNDFKGGLAENYVYGQLAANGYPCYYWTSERGSEVDFVIQRGGKAIPIEVKSADNTRAKILDVYIRMYSPAYSVKLSTKNFGFVDGKKSVPLYAAFCL